MNNFRSACGIHSKATTTTATHIVGGIRRRMAKKSSFIKYSNLLKIITQAHLHGLLCSVFSVRCHVFEKSEYTRHFACLNLWHAIEVRKCYRITLKTNKQTNTKTRTEPN